MTAVQHIEAALNIIKSLGLPRQQQNKRSAMSLLALLDLKPGTNWDAAKNPLMGITPIMDWIRNNYGKTYAPNTRETIRRQTMHQFCDAGIAVLNPDEPSRPINSPGNVYQIEPAALAMVRSYGTKQWGKKLAVYLSKRQTITEKYAREREHNLVPVRVAPNKQIMISPGEHSKLIKAIVENFGARYVPNGVLLFAGDTGDKTAYLDEVLLVSLGITVDIHGKMPDVVLYCPERNWLLLIESVTSHGPVDGKRHAELARLFANSNAGLVYVTAFPNRALMGRYLGQIAWETEVWVADSPSHLIHFNGKRFLGPYSTD